MSETRKTFEGCEREILNSPRSFNLPNRIDSSEINLEQWQVQRFKEFLSLEQAHYEC